MKKNKQVIFLLVVLLLAGWGVRLASSDEKPPPPITQVNAQVLGPQRLGPLPPVSRRRTTRSRARRSCWESSSISTPASPATTPSAAPPATTRPWAGPTRGRPARASAGQMGGRRSPPVTNAAYTPLQFWDGRSPSLEEQAKGPIQNPIEMGNTHEAMIRPVADIPGYVEEFQRGVRRGPDHRPAGGGRHRRLRAHGGHHRLAIRPLRARRPAALTKLEKQGLEMFNGKGHCTACHWGPNFSDGRFHNVGVPALTPRIPIRGATP